MQLASPTAAKPTITRLHIDQDPESLGFAELAVLPDDRLDEAWALYEIAFNELRVAAAQRHVMHRREFDEVMSDPRVTKYVGYDGDVMCSLGTRTTDLDAVPLVSPDYFAARYPEHYAAGTIYYIGFLAVLPDYHGLGVFIDLIRAMADEIAACGGVAAMDVCRVNNTNFKLPYAVLRLTRGYSPDVQAVVLDEQSYWAYEFPAVS